MRGSFQYPTTARPYARVGEDFDRTEEKALTSAARGELTARGPRGGIRQTPRYFVRRVAWHVLDHAWEIEDCVLQTLLGPDLFQRLPDSERYVSVFGSAEKALEEGFGYCLMRDDTILCEAFAGPSANGVIEIGVETHAPYRRRGYATITCAHLIRVRPHLIVVSSFGQFCKLQGDGIEALAGFYASFQAPKRYSQAFLGRFRLKPLLPSCSTV